jgi:hypothetical protein
MPERYRPRTRFGFVVTFQREEISRMDNYFNQAEALEAGGLKE